MMSKPQSQKKEMRRFLLAVPVLAALFFVFSCEITPEEDIAGPTMEGEINKVNIMTTDFTESKLAKDGETIFDVVENPPSPPGGMDGWNSYLSKNLSYPAQARRMGVEGTVVIAFVVNTDGSLSDFEVIRGIGGGADEEAVRVIANAPDWTPGSQRGVTINTRMRVPIRFKLGADEVVKDVKLDFKVEEDHPSAVVVGYN